MIDTAADVSAMLADWGQPLTVGTASGVGVLRRNTQILLDDQLVYEGDSILSTTALCGQLTYGSTITLDGVAYVVQSDPFPSADGVTCRVPVSGQSPTVAATAEDLAFLQDWGQPLTIGATSGLGMLSRESVLALEGSAIQHGRSLLAAATLTAELRHGDMITLAGETYWVQHDPWISPDGKICRVPLTGPLVVAPIIPWVVLTTAGGQPLTTAAGLELVAVPGG
jgi:hypothetical protein